MEHFTITGILTKEECSEIISKLPDKKNKLDVRSRTLIPGKWTDAEWSKTRKQFNTHRIKLEQDSAEYISNIIKPISTELETLTLTNKDIFYVNYYNAGECAREHIDPSKYTICIALNDDFEGGEFFVNKKPVKLNTGDGVIFLGNTTHAVSEILSGSRWSLCVWVF